MDISYSPQDPASEIVATEIDNTTVPVANETTSESPVTFNENGAPVIEQPQHPATDLNAGGQ